MKLRWRCYAYLCFWYIDDSAVCACVVSMIVCFFIFDTSYLFSVFYLLFFSVIVDFVILLMQFHIILFYHRCIFRSNWVRPIHMKIFMKIKENEVSESSMQLQCSSKIHGLSFFCSILSLLYFQIVFCTRKLIDLE